MKSNILNELKQSVDPWVAYNATLLEQEATDTQETRRLRKALETHPAVSALLEELEGWPGTVLNSHKSAGQLYHKLAFLADIGLEKGNPKLDSAVKKILTHVSEEGIVQLPMNIPAHFGGSGEDRWAWALCDAPVTLYALARFGYFTKNPKLRNGTAFLVNLCRDNGWPCVVSKELGNFRGPGRKQDPCPYATLVMLKLVSELEEFRDSSAAYYGIESLLSLWQHSREEHPYMFFMGTDFRKLKGPYIWYDILHVLEVLSRFPSAWSDKRFTDMLATAKGKTDKTGYCTPESVWKAWNKWDFGQKKMPSAWLTLCMLRIENRATFLPAAAQT